MTTLLVTEAIARQYGTVLREAAGPDTTLLVLGDGPPPAEDLARVELAFLSTDLMGSNNKTHPNARLRAFGEAIAAAPALRWIHTCSSGADRDILQQALRRGVVVTTSSGANAMAVAHTAIAGMLALARGVPHWVQTQSARQWATQRDAQAPSDIDGNHALVVGTGPIGQAIARSCRALGLRVTGVRRDRDATDGAFDAMRQFEDLPAALADVDWVFLACPLTPRTRGLVDAGFLQALPTDARLVNVARGEVVDEAALHAALREGRLGGCYSDVFVEEPLPADSPWWDLPRTLVSAHSAGASTGFSERTVQAFRHNLVRLRQGLPLQNVAIPG